MKYYLIDDGTLDTVFTDENNREYRFNYQNSDTDMNYDDFLQWCLNELEQDPHDYYDDNKE